MNIDQFWDLIDRARDDGGDRLLPEFTDRFLTAIEDRLYDLELNEVVQYDARLKELCRRADLPGLRAANRMVAGPDVYVSDVDDGFVCGLISLGRETFERALTDPDSLSLEPLLRAVAEGRVPGAYLILDEMPDMAMHNYESRDESGDYSTALDPYIVDADGVDDADWDEDPEQVRRRLPRLSAMFAARTQTLEQAAARKQRLSTLGWVLLLAAILAMAVIGSFIGRALEIQP